MLIPQVSGCQKVSETRPKTNPRPKKPNGPGKDKIGERTGPSQTGQDGGEKRKTPNFAHPGFVTILTVSGLGRPGRMGKVITATQVIEIGMGRSTDKEGSP